MQRFQTIAEQAGRSSRKLAGIFLTNGFPDLPASRELLQVIDDAGADFLELGMPFSDPLAEGLPIQRSSARALAGGVRMRDALETAAWFRARSETPLFLMGYVNPILRYGSSNFFRDAHSSGVDGVILPDLPPGSGEEIADAAHAAGLDVVNLIAPNTPDDRIREIDEVTTGFVYAVSVTGLTGAEIGRADRVQQYLARARALVRRNPLLVGFGIKSRTEAQELSRHTDGFIVGSALITLIERLWEDDALTPPDRLMRVRKFIGELTGSPESMSTSMQPGAT